MTTVKAALHLEEGVALVVSHIDTGEQSAQLCLALGVILGTGL